MRTPRSDKRTTSMIPSPPSSNNVKLTPLSKTSTPTNKKERKKRDDRQRKKAKSRHFSTSRSPRNL
ncbi:hypothetical protein Avbf_13650 [Armadillidium vulgare]|nr:hypothetical protein Avbf_13650 [Armadillidium vulgare]